MRAEAIAVVADRLRDPVTGLNALRTVVPKDAGWPVPPAATVLDSLTTPWVGRGLIDRSVVGAAPLVLVASIGELSMVADAVQQAPQPVVEVGVRYVVAASQAQTMAALTAIASCTLRCAWRAIATGWNQTGITRITRNGVAFDEPTVRSLEQLDDFGDDVAAHGLIVTLPFTDPWALSTS